MGHNVGEGRDRARQGETKTGAEAGQVQVRSRGGKG